jgi:hypothetical protein
MLSYFDPVMMQNRLGRKRQFRRSAAERARLGGRWEGIWKREAD